MSQKTRLLLASLIVGALALALVGAALFGLWQAIANGFLFPVILPVLGILGGLGVVFWAFGVLLDQ